MEYSLLNKIKMSCKDYKSENECEKKALCSWDDKKKKCKIGALPFIIGGLLLVGMAVLASGSKATPLVPPKTTHWECVGGTCTNVPGNTPDTCSNNAPCGHYGCQGTECVWIIDDLSEGNELPDTCNFGSNDCVVPIPGCTDPLATNFNPDATANDGSCTYPSGCTALTPDLCPTQAECEAVGDYWYNNKCNLNLPPTQAECNANGGYWYNGKCNAFPQGTCVPGTIQSCGNCGSQTCKVDGSGWGICGGQGCTPGVVNVQYQNIPCGLNGTGLQLQKRTQTCGINCQYGGWSAWTNVGGCIGAMICTPKEQTVMSTCKSDGKPKGVKRCTDDGMGYTYNVNICHRNKCMNYNCGIVAEDDFNECDIDQDCKVCVPWAEQINTWCANGDKKDYQTCNPDGSGWNYNTNVCTYHKCLGTVCKKYTGDLPDNCPNNCQ